MARLFVAVWPPPDVLDLLGALPRPEEPGVRWVRPEHWHVTLRFLGEADPGVAASALTAIGGFGPVEAVVGPRVSRLGRSVVCLPVEGLAPLAAAVATATAEVGDPPDPRPFAGHLTLARLRHRAACGVAGAPLSARFAVDEVVLVASTLDDRGPTYEVQSRVALAPA